MLAHLKVHFSVHLRAKALLVLLAFRVMGCVALDMTAMYGFAVNISSFDEETESQFVSHGQKILKTFIAVHGRAM